MKRITYISLFIFVFIGIFADFIANEKPIIAKVNNSYTSPIFQKTINTNTDNNSKTILNPIIRYSYYTIDKNNAGAVSPFAKQHLKENQQRHYLGTDQLGRDVLAGIIHGTSIALKIGFISMFLALLLGLLMSLYPSYFGDTDFYKSRSFIIISLLLFFTTIYYTVFHQVINSIIDKSNLPILLIPTLFALFLVMLYFILNSFSFFNKRTSIPLDSMFSTIIKIFQSLPGSFIVLILISLFTKPSVNNIIIVIAILKWPILARYIRGDMLKIKEEKFIEASKALGLSNNTIIWRHAFPHVLTSVIISLSFGFAGTILLESTLSFLGIGIPADHVSWGSILSAARHNMSAWWLAIFPGFAIFLSILLFNSIGNQIKKG